MFSEEGIKVLFRDWMYNWGYYPKGFPTYFINLGSVLQKGKIMIPFYDRKDYKIGSRNYIILDDLFELQINEKAQKSPFNLGENTIPKNIAFEYKGNGCGEYGMQEIYRAIGQTMVYYCVINQPLYLVIDIKNYLMVEGVFAVLPFGVICYRVKSVDNGIKIFKHPNLPPMQ